MADEWQDEPETLVYANWARVGTTPFELSLDLGYRSDPVPPVQYPVRVLMSWEQAKSLVGLLQDALETFEGEVGPIRDVGGPIGPARQPGTGRPLGEDGLDAS